MNRRKLSQAVVRPTTIAVQSTRSNLVRTGLFGALLLIGLLIWFLVEPPLPPTVRAAQAASTPTPPLRSPMAEVVVDSLSVKSCPTDACPEVGTAARGTEVELLDCLGDGSWCQISLPDGQSGWATSASLRQGGDAQAGSGIESEGSKIAFLSTRDHLNESAPGYELYLMNSDGGQQSRLTAADLFQYSCSLAWLAKDRQFFFTDCGNHAEIINLADGLASPWQFPGSGDGSMVQYSPDGQKLAYVDGDNSASNIFVVDVDGTNQKQLTDFSDGETVSSPSWSPDGEKLAFGVQSANFTHSFWVMNADGSNQVKLADVFARLSAWSSDGQQIAFECGIPNVTRYPNQDLCVINSDGTNLIRLTNSTELQVTSHPTWSPDGTKIAFAINAGGIAADPGQIYVVDADGANLTQLTSEGDNCCPVWLSDRIFDQAGTELVSIVPDGGPGITGGFPIEPQWRPGPTLSADGRYVVFSSRADYLVEDDTNQQSDVFVYDRQTGQTQRVSVASSGVEGSGGSSFPSISADGRYVAFSSSARNLVSNDTNDDCNKNGYPSGRAAGLAVHCADVFVYDRQMNQISRVSVASDGTQGNGDSGWPSISADGRYVAFWSKAGNLVEGDTNDTDDVFVHDRQSGQTERVSVASNGGQGNGFAQRSFLPWAGPPAISADGRYVAYWSDATNLVAGDTNESEDVFIHDRETGETSRISITAEGSQANGHSGWPSISADGNTVVFTSEASNLVNGDTNVAWDIFVFDRQQEKISRVSVASDGTEGNGQSDFAAISADGRTVTFSSNASNLTDNDTNDTNEAWDVFIHDRQTGQTSPISLAIGGSPGDDDSFSPAISADGRYVAFWSNASNLADEDTNDEADIFVYYRGIQSAPPDREPAIGDIIFALGATADSEPINPGLIFEAGITEIHAIFDYQGMSPDHTWERVWYHDGQEQLRSSTEWTEPEMGRFDYSLDAGGAAIPAGEWALEIYVEDNLLATGAFTIAPKAVAAVTPAPTVAPTATPRPSPTPTSAPPVVRTYPLAYSKWDGGFHNVYIGDTNGRTERLLIKRAAGPSWSPDGKRLFFLGQQGVTQQYAADGRLDCVFGTISDGIVALDIPPGNGDICAVYYGEWKCERKSIDVQSPPSDVCEQDGYKVFQNLDWKEGSARYANVAPDGSAVAYDAQPGGGAFRTYFRSILDNAQFHFELDGEQPDWSPDSQRLVYRSGRDGKQGLWISNRDDTNHINITINGSDSFPAWSPDGRTIAFAREEGGNVDIYAINADGSNLRRLTNAPGPDSLPTFTPSGEIIFRSARTGSWGIWKMSGSGANQWEIIPNAGVAPDWAYSRMDVLR